MYLDKLFLYKNGELLREPIIFRKGLNLIINSSPKGNSVGKTTFLHLVKYCLGGDISDIYKDSDNEKSEFNSIEDAFKKDEYNVKLDIKMGDVLVSIERQLCVKNAINKINGEEIEIDEFKNRISNLFIKKDTSLLPTWQQLKYKFIKPELKGTAIKFNTYCKAPELYTMWLFLLGYDDENILHKYAESKKKIGSKTTSKISPLENIVLAIEEEIKKLDLQKKEFILEKYTENKQQEIKEKRDCLEKFKKEVSILEARITNIENHLKQLKADSIDNRKKLKEDIRNIYLQANIYGIDEILEDYENVVEFHDKMLSKKSITLENMLLDCKKELNKKQEELNKILHYEKEVLDFLENEKLLPAYDNISKDLNTQYELLGQANERLNVEVKRSEDIIKYQEANKNILSSKQKIETKLKLLSAIFNKYCKDVLGEKENTFLTVTNDSNLLPKINRVDGKSKSSGESKKNIVLLDLAYLSFSIGNKDISVPHFIMVDSIENIDEIDLNQIFHLSETITEGQVIFTCLKDKLYNIDDTFLNKVKILELSKDNKIFKISEK